MSEKKKKNWFVRFVGGLLGLCVILVLLGWGAKMLIVPGMVRRAVIDHMAGLWSGPVEIDYVEVNIFSPSQVRGIRISDELGRTWLIAPEVIVETAWEGFKPRVEAVRISEINLSPQMTNGACVIPLKRGEPSGEPVDIAEIINDLQALDITVDMLTLLPVDKADQDTRGLEGISLPAPLSGLIRDTRVVFRKIEWSDGKLNVPVADGDIGQRGVSVGLTGRVEQGKFNLRLKPGRIAAATLDLAGSNIDPERLEWLTGSDKIVRSVLNESEVNVYLEATSKPDAPIEADGVVNFSGPIGQAKAVVTGQYADYRLTQTRADITGILCSGKLQAKISADRDAPDHKLKFSLDATARRVKMADLTGVLTPDNVMTEGLGSGDINLTMSGLQTASIAGRGAFFLDDSDMLHVPILSDLFKHMKMKLGTSDLEGEFALSGATATVLSGQLGAAVWAADFEKGGTIDLAGEKVEMHVIFLPIKQAGVLMNIAKAINPLRLVAKEIFRLRVTGPIDKPVIIPVPLGEVSKIPAGAIELLKKTASTGGQLGGGILKTILNGGK